jgi:hypothetical protein
LRLSALSALCSSRSNIADIDRRERWKERRLKAQALALLLHTQLVGFQGKIEVAISQGNYLLAGVQPPAALVARTDELYLLGKAGGLLLQMISTLNANEAFVLELQRLQAQNGEVWGGVKQSLDGALACCTEAIVEISRLIAPREK